MSTKFLHTSLMLGLFVLGILNSQPSVAMNADEKENVNRTIIHSNQKITSDNNSSMNITNQINLTNNGYQDNSINVKTKWDGSYYKNSGGRVEFFKGKGIAFKSARHIELKCPWNRTNKPIDPVMLKYVSVQKHCEFTRTGKWVNKKEEHSIIFSKEAHHHEAAPKLTIEYNVQKNTSIVPGELDVPAERCYGLLDEGKNPPVLVNPHAEWCPEDVGCQEKTLNKLTCNRFKEKFRSSKVRKIICCYVPLVITATAFIIPIINLLAAQNGGGGEESA